MPQKRTRGNGEGTIYNNGRYWVGQVTVGKDTEAGKLKRKSIYGKTKREVSKKIVDMQNIVNKGTFSDPTNMTVLVFLSKRKKIMYSYTIRENLKKICDIIGIKKINPHMLRHTFATRMLELGVNIKVLSDILGHKNIQITLNTYSHVLPNTKYKKGN